MAQDALPVCQCAGCRGLRWRIRVRLERCGVRCACCAVHMGNIQIGVCCWCHHASCLLVIDRHQKYVQNNTCLQPSGISQLYWGRQSLPEQSVNVLTIAFWFCVVRRTSIIGVKSSDPVQNKVLMRLATYIKWDLIPFWLCDYEWAIKSHFFWGPSSVIF